MGYEQISENGCAKRSPLVHRRLADDDDFGIGSCRVSDVYRVAERSLLRVMPNEQIRTVSRQRPAIELSGWVRSLRWRLKVSALTAMPKPPGVFLQKGNTEQDTTQLMQSLIQLGAILGPIVQQRFATAGQQQTWCLY